jgi:hypothetical protein
MQKAAKMKNTTTTANRNSIFKETGAAHRLWVAIVQN